MKIGQSVTLYNPGERGEHESWTRGVVAQTIMHGGQLVHVVRVNGFKWDEADTWGDYDGVPEVIAIQAPEDELDSVDPHLPRLKFVDTWPPREER